MHGVIHSKVAFPVLFTIPIGAAIFVDFEDVLDLELLLGHLLRDYALRDNVLA